MNIDISNAHCGPRIQFPDHAWLRVVLTKAHCLRRRARARGSASRSTRTCRARARRAALYAQATAYERSLDVRPREDGAREKTAPRFSTIPKGWRRERAIAGRRRPSPGVVRNDGWESESNIYHVVTEPHALCARACAARCRCRCPGNDRIPPLRIGGWGWSLAELRRPKHTRAVSSSYARERRSRRISRRAGRVSESTKVVRSLLTLRVRE